MVVGKVGGERHCIQITQKKKKRKKMLCVCLYTCAKLGCMHGKTATVPSWIASAALVRQGARSHRRQEMQCWSALRANGEGQSMHRGAQGERYVWGFIPSFAMTRFICVFMRWRRLHIYRRSQRFFRPARSSCAYLFLGGNKRKKEKKQQKRDRYKFLFFFISCVSNQQIVSPYFFFAII